MMNGVGALLYPEDGYFRDVAFAGLSDTLTALDAADMEYAATRLSAALMRAWWRTCSIGVEVTRDVFGHSAELRAMAYLSQEYGFPPRVPKVAGVAMFPVAVLDTYKGHQGIPTPLKVAQGASWIAVRKVMLLPKGPKRRLCWQLSGGCHRLFMENDRYRAYVASVSLLEAKKRRVEVVGGNNDHKTSGGTA